MTIYLLSAVFCLIFLFATIELIRRQKLEEQYALLWLGLGLVMLPFCLFPDMLPKLSELVRIHYPPSLLFLIGLAFSLVFILHLTIVISKLQRKLTRLVQQLALLEAGAKEGAADDRHRNRPT
ncbi:DUF2304 domain-containing protein [Paenibacillus flagellatus]|uniref:DUF2304 domain-containing protein n=1 Tax=Paenibacillus flagellatus TaxID=2211139 RepID=A0A2V5K5U5_9BACL|nr:DUF2304 domain-containing protein [Paenibacillus flagellatus]PYI53123.1 DUF2304 domain-containing protein [Paenibacillus flagellatus]